MYLNSSLIASGCLTHRRYISSWETLTIFFRFLSLASQHSFVMNALLAFSASHLAWISTSAETRNLAYQHGAVALKGLQMALANFSKANSDAVLAASLLLSWQAHDWYVTVVFAVVRSVLISNEQANLGFGNDWNEIGQ